MVDNIADKDLGRESRRHGHAPLHSYQTGNLLLWEKMPQSNLVPADKVEGRLKDLKEFTASSFKLEDPFLGGLADGVVEGDRKVEFPFKKVHEWGRLNTYMAEKLRDSHLTWRDGSQELPTIKKKEHFQIVMERASSSPMKLKIAHFLNVIFWKKEVQCINFALEKPNAHVIYCKSIKKYNGVERDANIVAAMVYHLDQGVGVVSWLAPWNGFTWGNSGLQ